LIELLAVCVAAFLASGLTLFSGFGLGTILLPVFALFFPLEVAVASTAVVHFLNNLFKLALLGRRANREAVIRFGAPAVLSALLGAWVLLWFADLEPVLRYRISGHGFSVTPVKLVISVLMIVFALFELVPSLERLSFGKRYLPLGGALSGFFGGLSGHQGALRSAFLIKCGLSKEAFVATGVVIACLVDVSRLAGYGSHLSQIAGGRSMTLLAAAVLSAFLGAFLGNRLLGKVTIRFVQRLVAVLLFLIAGGLAAGVI